MKLAAILFGTMITLVALGYFAMRYFFCGALNQLFC